MGLPKMQAHFIEPYLTINSRNQVAYIRDILSWEEIELVYSDDIKDLNCQLLFYGLKIVNLVYESFFRDINIITYNLQYL